VAGAPADLPGVSGQLTREGDDLVFIPAFAFDPGRSYLVQIEPSLLAARQSAARAFTVALPAPGRGPATVVSRVLPSAEAWPANTLRFYVEFSGPMSRTGGLDYVRLLDEDAREVVDPFLPLDVDFWNQDYTRYTFFFDPGRVKRDILPNREMGRALVEGRRYTIEIAAEWRDAGGLPLAAGFRHAFLVGPADESPVDPARWTIEAPAAGTRNAVVVRFREPLDHGLLSRAVGLTEAGGSMVDGEVTIGVAERSWQLTPRNPWRAGTYELVVLSILEDLAGNRVGRPFEVDDFRRIDDTPAPARTTRTFVIAAAR
jgi:hypothetical protein